MSKDAIHFVAGYRNKLNCSQEEFAEFLNVSRSALSKFESNKRDLNIDLSSLAWISLHLENIAQDHQPNLKAVASMDEEMLLNLRERQEIILATLTRLNLKLKQMLKSYSAASIALEYYQLLLTAPEQFKGQEKMWLKTKRNRQIQEMQLNGRYPQYLLEVKIAQLEIEMKMNAVHLDTTIS